MRREKLNLIGIILLSAGLNGGVLIAIVSWLVYGEIFFYNDLIAGVLWTICLASVALGLVFVCTCSEVHAFANLRSTLSHITSSSKGRFLLIGIAYSIFFIIFALCGLLVYWLIITALFAIGLLIYVYSDYYKNSAFNPKTDSPEAKETKKKQYSIIIAICLALCLIITLLCSLSVGGSSSGKGSCDVCGGDGVVTHKVLGQGSGVQQGGVTYYRCGACHGTGEK